MTAVKTTKAMPIKCYMCGKDLIMENNEEYTIVQLHYDGDKEISYTISTDEVVAYICDHCVDKIKNIHEGYI